MKNLKLLSLILAAAMCLCLCACGSSSSGSDTSAAADTAASEPAAEASAEAPEEVEEEPVGMVNPLSEYTREEVESQTGIALPAESAVSSPSYYIIDDGTNMTAEMRFTVDGASYYFRAVLAASYDIASADSISGLYYDFTTAPCEVSYCDGIVATCDDAAYVEWIDVVPGVQFALCSAEPADADTIVALANELFVALQGDSGVTANYTSVIAAYNSALEEGWDNEQYIANGLSYMVRDAVSEYGTDSIGVMLYDLDNDGVDELIIGTSIDATTNEYLGGLVIDIYRMGADGEPEIIFSSGERDRLYSIADMQFVHEYSSGAYESGCEIVDFSIGSINVIGQSDYDYTVVQLDLIPLSAIATD